MGALLEITVSFLIFIAGYTGILGDFTTANNLAYVNNDTTKMQQALEQMKSYCAINMNGNPCVDSGGTAMGTTGNMPQTLTGYWTFYPNEGKTGTAFTFTRTANTNCISIDDPATFQGQFIPSNIPTLDPTTGALVAKVAATNYYLHADESKHGVYATTAAASTPSAC